MQQLYLLLKILFVGFIGLTSGLVHQAKAMTTFSIVILQNKKYQNKSG